MGLVVVRLILAILAPLIAWDLTPIYPPNSWLIWFLIIGLLTDIFDGILARRLGVSTPTLRRWDSSVDQVFFLSIAASTYAVCPAFFFVHRVELIVLIGAELLTYAVSYLRFRKEVATHTIGAKVWTLVMVMAIIEILYRCESTWLFQATIWIGVLTRLEIITIFLVLKHWVTDVPSIYHAIQLRKGNAIKKNRWFNG
ncbi:MAG: CDP-alcohol phosphatidyltransferase family protein [Flavobacteriales bacterium]|nr:CDP-alcohol phosphatidyltransferase family protein [Bacteroidota bacterium]MCB9241991.1 CDP-alcohol phosphatidyltransferase family protein [Flavobacteriales bacterium]